MRKVLTNLVLSDCKLRSEIKQDIKSYMKKPCTLEEFEELDDSHVFNKDEKTPTDNMV